MSHGGKDVWNDTITTRKHTKGPPFGIFSALWDFFSKTFFCTKGSPLYFFLLFKDSIKVFASLEGSPLWFFGTVRFLENSIFKNSRYWTLKPRPPFIRKGPPFDFSALWDFFENSIFLNFWYWTLKPRLPFIRKGPPLIFSALWDFLKKAFFKKFLTWNTEATSPRLNFCALSGAQTWAVLGLFLISLVSFLHI